MASVRSWSQVVRQADPDFDRESRRPWVYEFSNGRRFIDPGYSLGGLFILDNPSSLMDDPLSILAP